MSFTSQEFRKMMGRFATGVTIVTSRHQGSAFGMTVNSFTSVSLNPPLVLFCSGAAGLTAKAIQASQGFAINVLSLAQHDLCRRFAGQTTDPEEDRFQGLAQRQAPHTTSPWLEGCLGWFDCRLQQVVTAGDHLILLGEVVALERGEAVDPLIFFEGGWPTIQNPENG